MLTPKAAAPVRRRAPADFSADLRLLVLVLVAMAVVVGLGATVAAWILLALVALVTNLV